MAFTTALYYPWIDIQDERWLRTACLYWDRLKTIVPASIKRPYRTSASRELFDAGILEPLRVESGLAEIEELASDVVTYLHSQEANELLLGRAPGRRASIHIDKLPGAVRRLARLHPEKLPYELRRFLEPSHRARNGWLEVEHKFADFYMTLLATRLAGKHALGLLTSSFAADRLANNARSGARSWAAALEARPHPRWPSPVSRELVEGILVDLVVDGFSIAPDVTLKRVLAFRKTHSAELGRLRTKIAELATAIPADAPPAAVRQRAQDLVTNEIGPALTDLRAALRGSRIKALTEGLLKISVLSAAPTSALVIAGLAVPTALAVGAGISLTAMAALLAVDKEKTLRENPFSYLLAVERTFV